MAELEARAHDVQMLKFGQEVDMELLDALGASRGTEELRAELARQEAQHAKELAEWDAKIAQRTDELVSKLSPCPALQPRHAVSRST